VVVPVRPNRDAVLVASVVVRFTRSPERVAHAMRRPVAAAQLLVPRRLEFPAEIRRKRAIPGRPETVPDKTVFLAHFEP